MKFMAILEMIMLLMQMPIEKIANEHAIFAGMKLAVSKINKTADKYNCTVRIKAASQTSAIDVNVTLKEYKEELKGDLLVGDQNKGTIYIVRKHF